VAAALPLIIVWTRDTSQICRLRPSYRDPSRCAIRRPPVERSAGAHLLLPAFGLLLMFVPLRGNPPVVMTSSVRSPKSPGIQVFHIFAWTIHSVTVVDVPTANYQGQHAPVAPSRSDGWEGRQSRGPAPHRLAPDNEPQVHFRSLRSSPYTPPHSVRRKTPIRTSNNHRLKLNNLL
jgi:hypothetical protein